LVVAAYEALPNDLAAGVTAHRRPVCLLVEDRRLLALLCLVVRGQGARCSAVFPEQNSLPVHDCFTAGVARRYWRDLSWVAHRLKRTILL